ncbi:helix-turn-helix transcriptional regulator [Glutamicibacter ardleyensis]|uniref:Helix-turn-helix domain-containing protein n=1 Tax=Glutamicibacter ardleyensis TaxID=225894 RepID=A0ABQ2DGZ4_9MICC|nr:helix-turn-helix domain-containing protein [Glutamicibacter ardleyensis]GGJ56224.1 hypothetical protein GCM10007173_13800 [Glutamicibacter ardleyensis]
MEETKIRYLTAAEVAEQLKIKPRTVDNWRYRTEPYGPPYTHIAGQVRYPAEKFNAWCEEQNSKAIQ